MIKTTVLAICASLLLSPSLTLAAHAAPPSIEDFATRPVMSAPAVSPNGKYIAYRVAQTKKGEYYIEVRETDNMAKDPVRLGSKNMEITGFRWLSDDDILVDFIQQVRDQVKTTNQGVFDGKTAIVKANGKGRWVDNYDDLSYVGFLPNDPEHVLVETSKIRRGDDFRDRSIGDALNPDYYLMKPSTGALVTRRMKGNPDLNYRFDSDGWPRIATTVSLSDRTQSTLYRDPGEGQEWKEIYVAKIDDLGDRFEVLGFDPDDSSKFFVSATNGADVQSVYVMDPKTGTLGEKILSVPGQDVNSVITDPRYKSNDIIGFRYINDDGLSDAIFLDGEYDALYQTIKQAFPGHEIFFNQRTFDDSIITFTVRSPTTPSTYYMVKDGGLVKLGESRGNLSGKTLFNAEYITYKARDGRTIPAYVTKPEGKGPFPLIVIPHGGPWVELGWTSHWEWTQFLVSQGYMVIDPGFRGTTGLGTEHWTSSFGEWGKAMSDDMDDGVTHLVNKGLADPERVAMFGWSFGGYSAFAAAVRSPEVYNCTIPGAGVSDIPRQRAAFVRDRFNRALLEVGYEGLNQIKAEDVKVPMLIIHGELDQRVRVRESDSIVKDMNQVGKPFEYIKLENADHFNNTLNFDHRMKMYEAMADFLKTDCGFAKR